MDYLLNEDINQWELLRTGGRHCFFSLLHPLPSCVHLRVCVCVCVGCVCVVCGFVAEPARRKVFSVPVFASALRGFLLLCSAIFPKFSEEDSFECLGAENGVLLRRFR
jgi:hypothetical protein